jgi:hypothetical protein
MLLIRLASLQSTTSSSSEQVLQASQLRKISRSKVFHSLKNISHVVLNCHAGFKVLLLEARDRVGGRAWTSVVDGYSYEIGAAWLLWNQPHVFSQLSRYDMKDEIKATFETSGGVEVTDMHYALGHDTSDPPKEMTHDEEDLVFQKPAELYFNVDGQMGRAVMPYPQMPFYNKDVLQFDSLTAFERLDQIRDQLSALEASALEAYLLLMSGGTPQNTGFLDMLHWWALCNYKSDGLGNYEVAFKLKCGTTGLAMRILEDGLKSGNLTTKFSSPVKKISESNSRVTITTDDGNKYTSSMTVSTIPLNVLKSISFSPPLSGKKATAIGEGHVGLHSKVHFEARGTDLRSWSGYSYPGHGLLYAYGDDTTPASNTHIVSFGASSVPLHPEDSIEKTKAALLDMRKDIQIDRILFHNWVRDPYSKGSWCTYRPNFATHYLSALQENHGRVYFASADWADGWRGFVDGALEQGARVAQKVADALAVDSGKRS